jgi:hypothetical protein
MALFKVYNLCVEFIRNLIGKCMGLRIMVYNATFNNISAISWPSVLLAEEIRSTLRKH